MLPIELTSSSNPYCVPDSSFPQAWGDNINMNSLEFVCGCSPPSKLTSGVSFFTVLIASCGAISFASGYCFLNCALSQPHQLLLHSTPDERLAEEQIVHGVCSNNIS